MRSLARRYAVAVLAAAVVGIGFFPMSASATLHGYCAGAGQCVDNGTNAPTTNNPPVNFGFTSSPGGETGILRFDFLLPNNVAQPANIPVTGTISGTATLFSATPWTSGQLDAYLGISASPTNPIGAYLPSTQGLDPGATGFFVYQLIASSPITLNGQNNPNVSPLENIGISLPVGSYIVGFINLGTAGAPNFEATANSGAIFETGPPRVPEPMTLLLIGTGLLAVGASAWTRRQR